MGEKAVEVEVVLGAGPIIHSTKPLMTATAVVATEHVVPRRRARRRLKFGRRRCGLPCFSVRGPPAADKGSRNL